MRGPAPKPNARRRNKPIVEPLRVVSSEESGVPVEAPAESDHWHESAKRWWRAAKVSQHASLFQQSDWAAGQLLCDWLTELMEEPGPIRASTMQQIWSMMSDLLTTVGSRQRLRIELARSGEQKGLPSGFALAPADLTQVYGDVAG